MTRKLAQNRRRRLIPSPIDTFEDQERFHHRDVPGLTSLQLWAEALRAEDALSKRVFQRRRLRIVAVDPLIGTVSDLEWIRARITRLRRELRRRGVDRREAGGG